jgi:negative regulator of replication initiation
MDFVPFDQPSMSDFARRLLNLQPFATPTASHCETNNVDHELWAETQHNPENDVKADHECRRVLFSSAFKKLTRCVDQNPITINIDDV